MAAPRNRPAATGVKPQYSLAAFVREATREPWVMDTGNGAPVVIEQPTEGTMKAVAAELDSGDVTRWRLVEMVAGEAAAKVLNELIDDWPAGTAERIWESIEEHFGWGNSAASPGS